MMCADLRLHHFQSLCVNCSCQKRLVSLSFKACLGYGEMKSWLNGVRWWYCDISCTLLITYQPWQVLILIFYGEQWGLCNKHTPMCIYVGFNLYLLSRVTSCFFFWWNSLRMWEDYSASDPVNAKLFLTCHRTILIFLCICNVCKYN